MDFFKIVGIIGLLLISAGIIIKNRKTQSILFITGGIFMEIYSVFIGDIIFIILQVMFISSAVYAFFSK